MTRSRTHTFGPGSLESISVRTTVLRRDPANSAALYLVTVFGHYAVYCGNGDEHWFRISERDTVWSTEVHDDRVPSVLFAHAGSNDAAVILADTFIGYALEDWDDPCEDGVDEDVVMEPVAGA